MDMSKDHLPISGDSHLEVDAKDWVARVPAPYRDQAPRLARQDDGTDIWLICGKPARPAAAADLYGGKGRENYMPFGATYEGTPGTGTPDQRLAEQDQDGIGGEVLFPSQQGGPKLWRRIPDDRAYKAVVHAYNGWLAEEYCAVAPERLIGVGIIPKTNLEDSLDELAYCKEAGLKSVVLMAFPSGKSYPSEDDDRFWAKALDLDMPVTVHVGLERLEDEPSLRFPEEPPELMAQLGDVLVKQVSQFSPVRGSASVTAVQMVLSGLFDRFPGLRVCFAENQIGWIPFFLQSADVRYERNRHWAAKIFGFRPLSRPPSEYIVAHCLWGFQFDPVGVELRHHLGVGNLMWGSDFPHQESEWPHSQDVIARNFAGVPDEERNLMTAGNVIDFFRLA
jgi:predicted TIM-barrel fold metal-dependent hydrolase